MPLLVYEMPGTALNRRLSDQEQAELWSAPGQAHRAANVPGEAGRRNAQRIAQLLRHNGQAPAGVAVDLGQCGRA